MHLTLEHISRRLFARALAGIAAAPRVLSAHTRFYSLSNQSPACMTKHTGPKILLEAIAGPHLPHTQVMLGFDSLEEAQSFGGTLLEGTLPGKPDLFELRVYGVALDGRRIEILRRAGIQPILLRKGTYLIPFDSLAARGKAWDAVAADPEWVNAKVDVSKIEIYRAVQLGGRILEMSL